MPDTITQNKTELIKQEILLELKDKLEKREGSVDLIAWLQSTDFFTSPSSTIFHGNDDGGLAEHSLHVYKLLQEKNQRYNLGIKPDTMAICGLLHDVCKTNSYKLEKKNRKVDGVWREEFVWVVDDKLPLGHGEKSVMMIQRFIHLTDDELMAIRWHMGAFEPGTAFNYPTGYAFKGATKKAPIVTALMTADMEAANILEGDGYNPNHKLSEERMSN